MARCRALLALLLMASAVAGFATDYRLVVASDDPNTRQAASLAIFEGTGKLTKDDRITSITFSAGADIKSNCLVSLDPAAGKAALALSPDVEVYKGKVTIAGAKPTRKVIPANLSIDSPATAAPQGNKLSNLVQPIIHQVYNLPWGYIGLGVGIVLVAMFLMNRRSQAFTTTMSKEAKSLYLETVKNIVDRLDKIESAQHNLVKNPPVARAFRAQIEGFEARLGRLEKQGKDILDGFGKVSVDIAREGEKAATAAAAHVEAFTGDFTAKNAALLSEVEKLQADLGQFSKMQLAMREELAGLSGNLESKSGAVLEDLSKVHAELAEMAKAQPLLREELMASMADQDKAMQAHLADQAQGTKASEEKLLAEMASLRAELDVAQANLAALQTMPAQLEAVSASLPREFASVREAMPSLSHVEARLEKLDSIEDQLASMPDLQSSLEALPSRFDGLGSEIDRIHDTILHQIESLSGKMDHNREDLSELIAAHNFEAPQMPVAEEEPEAVLEEMAEPEAVVEEPEAVMEEEPVAEPEMELEAEEPAFTIDATDDDVAEGFSPRPERDLKDSATLLEESDSFEVSAEEEAIPEFIREEAPQAEAEPEMELVAEEPVVEFEPEMEPEAEMPEMPEAIEEPAPEPEPEPEEPEFAAMPEFHFSHAIDQIVNAPVEEAEPQPEVPMTFKLEPLPDHLDTFEDADESETLPAFHEPPSEEESEDIAEEVLVELFAHQAPAEEADEEEPQSAHMGHWLGVGGSAARTWSSTSSRPMTLAPFENEVKPMTPIGTAPVGNPIEGAIYAFGRVVYSCGNAICSFWPGREDRIMNLDHPMPSGEWRMAAKGQNLFVAEKNRVKIVSLQGWFTLEQFSGEYLDMVLTDDRWVGLRNADGAVLDFRDHRGQMMGEVNLNAPAEGMLFAAEGRRCFAGTADGRLLEVAEHGYEELSQGPEGYRLAHLCLYQGTPLALFSNGVDMQCVHGGKSCTLDMAEFGGVPVLMGGKLYLADLAKGELVTVNLKKMQASSSPALEGVSEIRRMIGIQHRSHQSLFAVACGAGKSSGRLLMIDPKSGKETKLCAANQSNIDLIGADHHLVLASSCQYQNVIRVLEPFVEKVAA